MASVACDWALEMRIWGALTPCLRVSRAKYGTLAAESGGYTTR